MVKTRAGIHVFASPVLALALAGFVVVASATAAEPAAPRSAPSSLPEEELDEVLVNGVRVKPVRDPQQIVNWLKLLVGKFRYFGYVQLRPASGGFDMLQVGGVADCTAFGRAPGVVCTVNVSWPEVHEKNGDEVPGGISTLSPAMVQYGLDPDHFGIRFLQVDNKGFASAGEGYLVADTLSTTTPCADMPGDCKRITSITPRADGKSIEMQTDIELDGRRLVRYKFTLGRVGPGAAGAVPGKAK